MMSPLNGFVPLIWLGLGGPVKVLSLGRQLDSRHEVSCKNPLANLQVKRLCPTTSGSDQSVSCVELKIYGIDSDGQMVHPMYFWKCLPLSKQFPRMT